MLGILTHSISPLSLQARHHPSVPGHPQIQGAISGQKGLPPALEVGMESDILSTETITQKGVPSSREHISLPQPRVWFEEGRVEASKTVLLYKKIRQELRVLKLYSNLTWLQHPSIGSFFQQFVFIEFYKKQSVLDGLDTYNNYFFKKILHCR